VICGDPRFSGRHVIELLFVQLSAQRRLDVHITAAIANGAKTD